MLVFNQLIHKQNSGNILSGQTMTDIQNNISNQQQKLKINTFREMEQEDDLSNFNMSEDPFDNLQLSQQSIPVQNPNNKQTPQNNMLQPLINRINQQEDEAPIDSTSNRIKDMKTPKKQRIKKKKLKKLKKSHKKQKKHKKKQHKSKLKKLSKDSDDSFSQNQSDQNDSQSDSVSSDELLANLNPKKKSKLVKLSSKKKERRTQKKQGFSLKQLGNNPQLDPNDIDDDQSYSSNHKKNKKAKKQKKQNVNNQDLLKKLLEIGLCVEEEANKQGQSISYQYDDGIDALNDMKKKQKKKGPKINNKLFSDMNLQENMFQNAEPLPPQIQLEVKPKQSRGLSSKASSFLNKTDQLKKIRSIDNVSKDDQYEKILAAKAKQSIVKMVKQKQLEQVQQIELDVKVPNITKGRSSGQLNNSMYFRKFSQNLQRIQSQKINPSPIKSTQDQVSKLSRKQLFNSLMNDMKSRKSQNITYQLIAKSFKTTQLQQVQQIRKKNAEKRRQKALRGSDDSDFSDQQSGNNNKNEIQQQNKDNNNNNDSNQSQAQQNINKMVDQNDNNKDEIQKQQKQNQIQIQRQEQNEETPKQQINNDQQAHQNQEYTPKKFKICVQNQQQKPNPISDEQYNKLLQIQAGEIDEQDHDQIAQQLEIKDSNSDNDDQISEQNNDSNDQFSDNDDGFEDIDISQSQKVDIQVDVPASQSMNSQIQSEHKETNKRLKRNNFLIQSDQQQQHMLIQKNEEIVKQIKLSEIQNPQQYSDKQICIKIKPESLSQKQNILSEQIINKSHQDIIEDDQINKEYQHDKNSIKNNQNDEARQQFRKLRKLATIIKQKKVFQKKMKIASDMFEEEAQEGSDNQDHDGQIKLINYDQQNKQYEGLDLDADLQGFLQQAVDIDEQNEQKAFRKYLEDIKIQDREQLKKIINGDFKRNRPDYDNYNQQIDQDEQNRIKRMKEFQEYIRKKDEEDPQGRYIEDNQQGIDQAYNPNQMQEQVVDQMNQENLKKYLDDNLANNKLATMKILKPKKQLPQSYQRVKKLQKRNTMKNSKQQITNITNPNNIFLQNNIGASKLKKTTSHLNHQFMKNKQKLKTIGTLKTILMKRK